MKVVGFVGTSGSGKTTVIERIVARLADTGSRVGVLTHARHGFDAVPRLDLNAPFEVPQFVLDYLALPVMLSPAVEAR